jgi:hypothetical protein
MPAVPPGGRLTSLVDIVKDPWSLFRRGRLAPPREPSTAPGGPVAGREGSELGPSFTAEQVTRLFQAVFQPQNGIFSPSYPLVPVQPEQPRTWDFWPGWNLLYEPRHEVGPVRIGFPELRGLAENHELTRLCIETRKDQIEKLDWSIRTIDEKNLVADAPDRIDGLTQFWKKPDRERPFATWLRELLEDMMVIDAPCCEVRKNRGGEIIGLDVIDGATIKPLIDDTGRRPMHPAPAYLQTIRGRPWRLLTVDELVYMPRNQRPFTPYGMSPVEQVVTTVNIGLRRQTLQLQHFTEGNVPPGLINAPDGWNPEQVRQFQEWFDSILVGNTALRTRLLWTPSGAKYQALREAPYKDQFDEWLARVVCYAFSLPPTPFVERAPNRSSSETLQEAALAEGLAPLTGWVKRFCDSVIQDRMGHADLQFVWNADQPMEAEDQAKILVSYVKEGIYTRNEARSVLGLVPIDGGNDATVDARQGPLLVSDLQRLSSKSAMLAQPLPAPAGVDEQGTLDGGAAERANEHVRSEE